MEGFLQKPRDGIWHNLDTQQDKDKKIVKISDDFRPKNEKIVKGIITRSLLEDPYADNNLQKIGGIKSEQIAEWRIFLYSNHIGDLYLIKLKKWLAEVDVPEELKELLKKLNLVYSKKRIEVFDVLYDSGGIYDVYII